MEKKTEKRMGIKTIAIIFLAIVVVVIGVYFAYQMSHSNSNANEGGLQTAVISYAGGTCETPVYVAYTLGFFKDEGLNVTLVQSGDWNSLMLALDTGKIDACEGNFQWFPAIAQGLNVKLTAGIHTGCIELVVPPNSSITTLADLEGKAVGVDSIGGGPQIALTIALDEQGLNPNNITWIAYPGAQMEEAVSKGEIAAFCTWDPFPAEAVADDGYTCLLNMSSDAPFNTTYCCFVAVSGVTVQNDPAKAAAITKAILMGAEWTEEHPLEAAEIAVNGSYVGGTVALNAQLLASYNWDPSISQGEASAQWWITQELATGILSSSTNVTALYNQSFAQVINDSQIPPAPS